MSSIKSGSNKKDKILSSSNESNKNKEDKTEVKTQFKKTDSAKIVSQNTSSSKVNNRNLNKPRIVPPPQWFFPSWISFIQYGPFVSKEKRLSLLEITDASKNVVKSRAEKRKAEKLEKVLKRVNDSSADRGYNTDKKKTGKN